MHKYQYTKKKGWSSLLYLLHKLEAVEPERNIHYKCQ